MANMGAVTVDVRFLRSELSELEQRLRAALATVHRVQDSLPSAPVGYVLVVAQVTPRERSERRG